MNEYSVLLQQLQYFEGKKVLKHFRNSVMELEAADLKHILMEHRAGQE